MKLLVQNDARSRFFLFLLDGDPWLSFESTQYHDVRNGKLPDEKFISALRRIEQNRFEYYRFVAAKYWSVYSNEEYRFSLRYPAEGEFSEMPGRIHIRLPKLEGTDFDTRDLSFQFRTDDVMASQLIHELPLAHQNMYVQRQYVEILGLMFLKELEQDAGMSRAHELVSYSTARNSKVVTISFHLATTAPGVYGLGPGRIVEIDREVAKEIILYVVSSFTWLD